jgi:acetoacetate decarboxylase
MNSSWSTPLNAPLYPTFPIEYRGVRIMSVVYRSDAASIQAGLPNGLVATSDHVMVHCYDMPDVQGMGKVQEANVMVGVRAEFEGVEVAGGFSTALIISSDVGLAQGREVHGQPKKLGEVLVEARGDTLVGEIHRNGIRAFRATTPYKFRRSDISVLTEIFGFQNNINHKVIPNIDGTLAVNQITLRTLKNVTVHECWTGPVTVEIAPHIQVPLHRNAVVEPVSAFYWVADFELRPGVVVHDYLGPANVITD